MKMMKWRTSFDMDLVEANSFIGPLLTVRRSRDGGAHRIHTTLIAIGHLIIIGIRVKRNMIPHQSLS